MIVSHGYTVGLQEEFIWQATMDYTGYLSVAACVATYRCVSARVPGSRYAATTLTCVMVTPTPRLLGPKRIMARNHNLALWAGNMLAKAWGTDLLTRADHVGSLVVVRVPDGNFTAKSNLVSQAVGVLRVRNASGGDSKPILIINTQPRMSRTLRYDHDIECVICAYNGSMYVVACHKQPYPCHISHSVLPPQLHPRLGSDVQLQSRVLCVCISRVARAGFGGAQ